MNVLSGADHEVAPFAAHDHGANGRVLGQDELGHAAVDRRVEAAGQAPVGGDGNDADAANGADLKQGMDGGGIVGGLGGEVGDNFPNFLGVGPPFQHRVLGAAHLGGGNQ